MDIKTPISMLQEYLVKRNMVPQYELTLNGIGTHDPEFAFRVKVGALWEEGRGKSKRQAKHRAAEKMLQSLKVMDDKETNNSEEILELMNDEFKENYVGKLKEYCNSKHYPEPDYDLEEEAGPSHCKVFKITCRVSQLQDSGIGKTKKLAKHQAASKMLEKLKLLGKNDDVVNGSSNSDTPIVIKKIPEVTLSKEEIIAKYNAARAYKDPSYKEPPVYYKDMERAYVGIQEESSTLAKLLEEGLRDTDDCLGLVTAIADELGVGLSYREMQSKDESTKLVLMTMGVVPPIAALGIEKDRAAKNLINSLLQLCK